MPHTVARPWWPHPSRREDAPAYSGLTRPTVRGGRVASFRNRPAGAVPPVPRRVLVLSHTAQTGGAELALERLVRAMAPSGHRLTVVLLEHGPMEERLAEAGAAVRVVELSQRFVSASRFDLLRRPTLLVAAATELARAARAVVRVGRELDVEVVWSNTIKAHVLGVLV